MARSKKPTNIAQANAVVRRMQEGRSVTVGEAKAALDIMARAYQSQRQIVRMKKQELEQANNLIGILSQGRL